MPSDKRRIDVFISSTSIDLPTYRQAVKDAILDLGFFPSGMENWPVRGENPVNLCQRMVNDAHIFIGIYAHRFGWRPGGYGGKSITELEYDWAEKVIWDGKPIPRLCFIMRDDHPWPKDKMELSAEADLKRFKDKVKANHVGFFTTEDNLKTLVTVALAKILADSDNGQVQILYDRLPDGTQPFTDAWFQNQVRVSSADAEASMRYLPQLHIELPITRLFDALGRTKEFFDRIYALHKDVRKRYNSLFSWAIPDDELNIPLEAVRGQSANLFNVLNTIEGQPAGLLPFDEIRKLCGQVIDIIGQAERAVGELTKRLEGDHRNDETRDNRQIEQLKHQGYKLQELEYAIINLAEFAQSTEATLANNPFLLLVGEGGIGKTHLFCDVASQRCIRMLPTILLLGEKFGGDEPWHQVIRQLMLDESRNIDEHLRALDDFAAKKNTRFLILIDALNEGEDVKIWPNYLGGILRKISQYPHIGVALSVRSEYETYIIPSGLIESRILTKVHHSGFVGLVDHAVRTYFEHYKIEYRFPPLQSEFQNPLFLQTLCLGLQNRNMTHVPTGLQGFTQILEFFLASVNERLAKRLEYNPSRTLVQSAIRDLVEEMASTGSIYVSDSRAEDIINRHLPHSSNKYTESMYYHLLAEGVLTTTIHETVPSVRFLYDRFTDHLIAQRLLEKYTDPNEPERAFDLGQPLGQILIHKGDWGFRYSLTPAFAIQIPEKTGLELFQVAPDMKNEPDLVGAMISSLVWRQWKTKEIPDSLIDFINETILTNRYSSESFLETILGVAANPDNPFNADFLHRNLMDDEMAQRDAWWSIFLHNHYSRTDEEQTSINRLISWAWSDFDKSSIDPEAIRLMGMALAWFLTSSNRYLRDQTTKALVSLFGARIPILQKVIDQFIGVNDPYVLERLFAVAYGCAMRSNDCEAIKALAEQVFMWIFNEGVPPPQILLRDYARGVIEVASVKCQDVSIPLEKVRPPYSSDWIAEPQSAEVLRAQYGTYPEDISVAERSMRTIFVSVMNWDFGNYIVSKVENWTAIRLQNELPKSPKEKYEQFFTQLDSEQLELWKHYQKVQDEIHAQFDPLVKEIINEWDQVSGSDKKELAAQLDDELTSNGYDEARYDQILNAELQKFLGVLTPEQQIVFESEALDYQQKFRALKTQLRKETHFEVELAKRWIVQRVFELGWTIERFGEFDGYLSHRPYDRGAPKVERIGKKYQWLAYHELLARIADNFHFQGDRHGNPQAYEGPWQTRIRDIDPSFIRSKTHDSSKTPNWWFTLGYEPWDNYETSAQWVKATNDLPEVQSLIELVSPEDGSEWLNLDAMFAWKEPIPPVEDEYERPRRRLWYMLKSYLIKHDDADKFYEWAQRQDFMGRWMPESYDVYGVLLGEFFWSPAYRYQRGPAAGHGDWEQYENYEMPCPVCVTIDEYRQEDIHDCSIVETVRLKTPSRWLTEHMGLVWRGQEGVYHNQQNDLVCFDPTISSEGPGSLLINRESLMKFLHENNLEIMWTLLGEKMLIGGDLNPPTERLKISGAYRLQNGAIVGSKTTFLESRKEE